MLGAPPLLNGSSFVHREILDPANVMHTAGGSREAQAVDALLKDNEVDMGTSIIAATYDGGVVIGADSRTSTGVYIANKVSDKLTKVGENIYISRSGSAADTQAIADYVANFLEHHRMEYGQAPKVATAANLFQQICYNNKGALTADLIVAGWDRSKGGQIFAVPMGGAKIELPFAVGGSGSSYVYGFCDSFFKPKMTQEQCEDFISRALAHAMARDGSSGGCIRMVTLSEAGAKRRFIPGNQLPFGPY